MIFRLGIIGHKQTLQELKEMIAQRFPGVEAVPIEFDNIECTQERAEEIKKKMHSLDGILYTRQEPFKMASRVMEHDVPVSYAEVDGSTFTHTLLEAVCRFHADIKKISIDSLDYEIIADVYRSIGIPADELNIKYVNVSTDSDHYVERIENEHRRNYKSGGSEVCITNIRTVSEQLTSEGIPCLLLTPNAESFAYEIRKLIVGKSIRRSVANRKVIVTFSMFPKNSFYTYNHTVFQEQNDRSLIFERIAVLAQRVNGALFVNGSDKCTLICEAAELEHIWEKYAKINILKFAKLETSLNLAIGIGYGETLRNAQINSNAAMLKAVFNGQGCAFVVYNPNKIVGPIESPSISKNEENMFSTRMTEMSEKSGISINTLFKIDEFLKRSNVKNFSSSMMAQELGISTRTANRFIDKMLCGGIIEESGRYVIGKKGRPTRMFQFII